MPTPLRNIRIPDEIWAVAQAKAASEGRAVSEVIRDALAAYVQGWDAKGSRRDA